MLLWPWKEKAKGNRHRRMGNRCEERRQTLPPQKDHLVRNLQAIRRGGERGRSRKRGRRRKKQKKKGVNAERSVDHQRNL